MSENVVIDTNVLVSALWSENGNCAKIIQMIPDNIIIPHYCEDIISEYELVLLRPKFKFQPRQVDFLLDKIVNFGKIVNPQKSDIILIDEDDQVFYDVAKTSNSILTTGNVKHFPSDEFIVTPTDFILKFL